ncbi:MAG: response regulator [Lentisphaerota bacterium]
MEILLIEDDEAVREFIREVLLGEGYFVSVAGNGNEGLAAIKSDPDIGMVITDIVMPEKEGIETIIEIKQDWPHIKILAMSGGGKVCAEEYLHIAGALGADVTLKKPFTRPELLGAVADLARHKNPDVKIPVIGDYPAVAEISGEVAV